MRAKYLRYLEEERFEQLPGHAYTKGFLAGVRRRAGPRRPALRRGVQPRATSSAGAAIEEAGAPRVPRAPTGRQRRRRNRRESGTVGVALAAILLVTALVIAAWRFGGHDEPQVDGVNAPKARTTAATKRTATQQQVVVTIHAAPRPVVHGGTRGQRHAALHAARSRRVRPQRFTKKSLSLSVDRPRNVVVKVERRAVRVPAGRPGAHGRPGRPPSAGEPRPRAVVVVTGSELVRGERTDRNGPFYAREALSLGLVPDADRDRRRRPERPRGGAPCARRTPTSASSPAGSGRRTTTARSSSSRGSPGSRSASIRSSRPDRGDLAQGRRAARPAVRRLRARGDEAGDACPRARSSSGSRAPLQGSSSRVGAASTSSCPARRASCAGSGRRPSPASPCRPCSRARRRPAGGCCASTASASRPWHVRSRRPGATATASRRRSARATSRSTSTSSSSRAPRRVPTTLEGAFLDPLRAYLFTQDEQSVAEIVLDLCRARGLRARDGRVVHRWARRRAPDRRSRARATSSRARSSPTRTRSRSPSSACPLP